MTCDQNVTCETERWAVIPACPEYMVSDLGRLRSVKFRQPTPLLKPSRMRRGKYLMATLRRNNDLIYKSVHRLVAEAFCPPRDGCRFVNHINGKKEDNRAVNLEWVTASENQRHAIDVLGVEYGAATRRAVIARRPGHAIGCVFKSTHSAEAFGFLATLIVACAKGRRRSHAGYTWEYLNA